MAFTTARTPLGVVGRGAEIEAKHSARKAIFPDIPVTKIVSPNWNLPGLDSPFPTINHARYLRLIRIAAS
ncbi:hypothetical protein ACOZ38_19830 [Sphaerisporangium viridialbum]|uniref:hypothetical protein n=1 Tax=Sphaerisporangium viridialbum TaxID=46189 RepID=UPI003C741B5E